MGKHKVENLVRPSKNHLDSMILKEKCQANKDLFTRDHIQPNFPSFQSQVLLARQVTTSYHF
jgi:hypothetical protein